MRGADISIKTVGDAFRYVFARLPARVFVYPTENYYYYTFSAGGVTYAGNLRLAAQDRDMGVLHVAAFRQANQAAPAGPMMYRAMTRADGVNVQAAAGLAYDVSYGGKTVRFQLNDVSKVKPPAEIVADGEDYLGNVFDESGLQFYLFYNTRLKMFAYVLNEQKPVLDQLKPSESGSRIEIGQRTGFAFYKHHYLNRRVLIGVHGLNTVVNNAFDGPADQLPENHIVDDNLRRAIVDANPDYKGALDPFGYLTSGEGRFLIAPYSQYYEISELDGYAACAEASETPKDRYDGCFIANDAE